ncbi:alpha/beta hydrolase family protein [Flagellimonas sp.]|uniref:alpha/beta hydrolase family protein n=1 Tax=Flagellimonas sp. TaxID=2058762 RepID=UPI003B524520
MKTVQSRKLLRTLFVLGLLLPALLIAQKETSFVYGDALPDAPELSARGSYKVGVRTLEFVNKGQVDVLNSKEGNDPLYDRPLTVEVWYPTAVETEGLISYDEVLGTNGDPNRPIIPFTFNGRATRDAAPVTADGKFPLVVVSHGYVGSRYLMTYLTENLASKGYIVAAIDHTESTFKDAAPFQSTLLNRSKDILFVVNEMAAGKHFLSDQVDGDNTGIVGYSMGGYGVLNVAGAAYSEFAINFFKGMTGGSNALAARGSASEEYQNSMDPRIKAVVAFAPWGMERGVWDAETLKGLKTPTLFVAGNQDDVSGYEKGIKAIYEGAINADRYLLTYMDARHNVAPNPPPTEALQAGLHIDEYYRYAEPSWDQRRINNINQHFVTAFLGTHLKQEDYSKFLDIKENSNEENWPGFVPRSSTGMELLHSTPE